MVTQQKEQAVKDLADRFKNSTATVVTEYRGLSVQNLTELRVALGNEAIYTVAKNTLLRRAVKEAGITGLDDLLVGPTAIAFLEGEPVNGAKALKTFAKDKKALVIKGGFMEGNALSVSDIEAIADLDSREVILAKIAGAVKGNLSKAASLFAAPATQAARLIAALEEKQQKDAPAE